MQNDEAVICRKILAKKCHSNCGIVLLVNSSALHLCIMQLVYTAYSLIHCAILRPPLESYIMDPDWVHIVKSF